MVSRVSRRLTLARLAALAAAPVASRVASAESAAPSVAQIDVDATRAIRKVPASLFGANVEWIWDGQGLWSAAQERLDPAALALARSLKPTVLRFPGGVFSDDYHWREGLGPQAKRPESEHTPGGPRSKHRFGIGEVSQLAADVGAELLLTVNAANGSAREAADWVRYMNREKGPRVRLWEVGNELYMKGDASRGHLSASEYASRFVEYAKAMRAVDADIRVGAIGGLNYGQYRFIDDPDWTRTVLERAAGDIDFLAIHDAYAPVVIGVKDDADPRDIYAAMLAAPVLVEQNLRDVSALLDRYAHGAKTIDIAVTEWGPLFHVSPGSPWVDHVKTMGSALYAASTLNVFLRSPRVDIATYFKLNDLAFMGLIARRGNEWAATAPFLALALYRRALRDELIEARVQGPTFAAKRIGVVDAVPAAPYVDAVATRDAKGMTILAVNKSEQPIVARLRIKGFKAASGKVEAIAGDALDANTGTTLPSIPGLHWAAQKKIARFDRGAPSEIHAIHEPAPAAKASNAGSELEIRLRPLSVTSIAL